MKLKGLPQAFLSPCNGRSPQRTRFPVLETYSFSTAEDPYIEEHSHQVLSAQRKPFFLSSVCNSAFERGILRKSAMESWWQVLQRERTLQSFSNFDHFKGFSFAKPAGVVDVHSVDLWRSYFEASKQNSKLLVIEFTASWCGPCRHMEQTMRDFAAKYTDVVFIRIDVDELQLVAQQFNVMVMPAFSLVKKGKIVDEVAGVKKNELENKIEKHRMII